MKRTSKVRNGRLCVEFLEDRVQPGSLLESLFGLPLDTALVPEFRPAAEVSTDPARVRLLLPDRPLETLQRVSAPATAAAPATGSVSVATVVPGAGASALPTSWGQQAASTPLPHLSDGVQTVTTAALLFSAGTRTAPARAADATPAVTPQPLTATTRLLAQVQRAAESLATKALTPETTPVAVQAITIPVTTYRFDPAAGPDTSLVYSTYFGMDGEDAALAITVDGAGNSYATGYFGFGDDRDLFVSKVNNQGQLDWVSFFGAPGSDEGHGVALDSTGNIYVTGFYTDERGDQEAIYARFRDDGAVQYVYQFVNAGPDSGNGIQMQGDNFYLTGTLAGENGSAVLVGRFALDGSVVAAVGIGISGSPLEGNGITTDPAGNAYVVGTMNEVGEDKEVLYMALDGAAQLLYAYGILHAGQDAGLGITLQSTPADTRLLLTGTFANETTGTDGFIAGAPAVNGVLDELVLITSGIGAVAGNGIITDTSGNPVITGSLGVGEDNLEAIVVKLTGGGLDYFLLKGAGNDAGYGITRGADNTAYVVGRTSSEDFPITEGALQPSYGGGASDAWGGLFGLD